MRLKTCSNLSVLALGVFSCATLFAAEGSAQQADATATERAVRTRIEAQTAIKPAEQETAVTGASANKQEPEQNRAQAKEPEQKAQGASKESDPTARPAAEPTSTPEPQPEQSNATSAESDAKPEAGSDAKPAQAGEREALKQPRIDRNGSFIGSSIIPQLPQIKQGPEKTNRKESSKIDYEPGEILLASKTMDAAISLAGKLQAQGLRLRSRQNLQSLQLVLSRFRLPEGENTLATLNRLRQQFPQMQIDTNQRYQLLSSARKTWAQKQVRWPTEENACVNTAALRIGMIDTSVNKAHPALQKAALATENFSDGEAASALHGTAIASLLVGDTQAGFRGLLPEANLFAANVFRKRDDKVESTTSSLVQALDWLASQKVSVVNLSLGGKQNRIFALGLESLIHQNITLVAAAGNNGPNANPVYPAAQQGVIAVTALDAAGRIYSQANRGAYIDFAAPGVDVWAADGNSGGQYHSGTSFAAPFVSAAFLLAGSYSELKDGVEDKGEPGKDEVFGWGLVQRAKKCRP